MTRQRPQWPAILVGAFSLVHGVLGLLWAFGAPGYPLGTGDPELVAEGRDAIKANLLGLTTPEAAGPVIAVLGFAGAAVAAVMARGAGRGPARRGVVVFGSATAVVLTVLIQDYRPLIVVAYTPILTVGKVFFGWPENAGFGDLYLAPRLYLLACLVAGIGWALATVAYARRTGAGCADCGRTGTGGADRLERWGRRAVWVAVAVPLVYSATRWAWALGFSLGIDPEFYRRGRESGLWLLGASLASLGVLGSLLTIGLVRRWGEVFPRWIPLLRGRRVPPMLAVVPAVGVAVLVTAAGSMYVRIVAADGITASSWPMTMPETLWPIWGAALFTAAMAYLRRRRPVCEACG